MQTILGAGGVVGRELAKALTAYTTDIRQVSRSPKKVNAIDKPFPADLTQKQQVSDAVKGSEVVYLLAGLKYDLKVWQQTWPVIMANVIDACIEHKSKLVFFDNVYLYSGDHLNPMTEETPIDPPSEKGKVRAGIIQMLWQAVQQKGLVALVARSADFYGPSAKNVSLLNETVFKPLSAGKTANLLIGGSYKHSYTYTPDAGKATALLGNTPDAYGQTWHLPTAGDPPTGDQWVQAIADTFGVQPKKRVAARWLLRVMSWFIPLMRESFEMLYQYDRHYVFNSNKFEKRFNMRPTAYVDGIKETIQNDYPK